MAETSRWISPASSAIGAGMRGAPLWKVQQARLSGSMSGPTGVSAHISLAANRGGNAERN